MPRGYFHMADDLFISISRYFKVVQLALYSKKISPKRKVKTTKNQVLIAIKNTAKDSFCFDIVNTFWDKI